MGASLETNKTETVSVKTVLDLKDTELDALNWSLESMEKELEKRSDVHKETTNEIRFETKVFCVCSLGHF